MKINLNVSKEFMEDLFSTAINGNQWAEFKNYVIERGYAVSSATVLDWGDEEKAMSRKKITLKHIEEGIRRVLSQDFNDPYPHARCHPTYSAALFKAIITNEVGDVDAELADLVLQAAFFGHIKYG